jgi:hypothetical protein
VNQEVLAALPKWLVDGALLGVGGSLVVAVLFYLAVTRFPDERASGESGTSEYGTRSTEDRRREEIRHYLDAIGEQYAEGHPVAGQTVDFYLPERDVAITFDARAFYRLEPTATEPVLVEHEMPGVALGHRLPFETPDIDFGDDEEDADVEPGVAAFAVLGLPAGAGEAEIKRAYRERVKEVHPDHGGDRDEFERVREAYATAKKYAS